MQHVLIAGGTGLIGSRLSDLLAEKGYTVSHLSRKQKPDSKFKTYLWDPAQHVMDAEALRNVDCLINLSGEGIADKKWTKKQKEIIISSRVNASITLVAALKNNQHSVSTVVCASAAGLYKKNTSQFMTEESLPDNDFLSATVEKWEMENKKFEAAGIRPVILRTGIVLSSKGGALKEMMKPLRFGIAAYFGNGRQLYSWIHIDDLCHMYIAAMEDNKMTGVYNAVAPFAKSNKEIVSTLAAAIRSFYLLVPVPAFLLKIILGERACLVLDGIGVSPKKIMTEGFKFQFQDLKSALKNILNEKK